MNPPPPPRWRALLASVLPERDRDVLLDEMDRLYASRAREGGERAAARWYRAEVLQFARRIPGERIRETSRVMGVEMADVMRLVRQTVRGLLRAPGFAAVAVLTLGLGIGASAVIFGIVDRALLRPLPFPEPGALVSVLDGWGSSAGSLEILQREMTTVQAVGMARNAEGVTLEREGLAAERITVASVSPEYLAALGVAPTLGRLFQAEESRPGRGSVALLSHDMWRTTYGADPSIVGRSVTLDGTSYEIVGVLPAGFDFPSVHNRLWRPLVMDPSNVGWHWGAGNGSVLARMAPGATPDAVRQELLRLQEDVRLANPLWTPNPGFWDEAKVVPLQEARAQWARTPLLILLGAVAVVLLVVCANVANLFLSRGLARGRDQAVRAALGAGAGRLAREQLLEALVLAAAGLVAGLALAWVGIEVLRTRLPAELPGAEQVTLDLRVVAFTAALALVTALLAGALPALRAARRGPAEVLREAGRGGSVAPSRRRTTRGLVAAQLAAAVVLVTSAGLLARTLSALSRVDPGFEIDGRVTAQVHLPPGLSTDPAARAEYFAQMEATLAADPAFTRVSFASTIPFGAEEEYVAMAIDGVTNDPNELPVMPHHRVTTGFFAVAGIPLVEGRTFTPSDRVGTPLVAVVDRSFVDRYLGGRPALGQIVRYPWRGAPGMEIVGVVEAVSHGDLAAAPEPTVWTPLAQMGMGALGYGVLVAEATRSPEAALSAVTARLREVDPRLAVSDLGTWRDLLGTSMAGTQLVALLLGIFAVTTLVLGCVGVYGVAAFSVRQRVKEIGVRMAMGAPVSGIRRSVLRDGLRLALPGGLLGLLLAVPAGRALGGLLYGIAPFDPLTFVAAPLVLALAALVAVYAPARRATRVDPAIVLRDD